MLQSDFYTHTDEIIKVIGIGGGGCNAVHYMHEQNMQGVQFFVGNTDAQCLEQLQIPTKIHLGPELTQGLGAGANPEIGRQATIESEEYIKSILQQNTKMVFITAGMGGGTGTGGAPVIAKIAKDLGILTIGIVTTPFKFEGRRRNNQAEKGISAIKEHVDTLLIISNEKLKSMHRDLSMSNAFNKADDVLLNATKCIIDVINTPGKINVDFADVCTVMRNGGVAIFGNAQASGTDRAKIAINKAVKSPLLNENDISGAKWILLNISSPKGEHEITMDEIDIIQETLIQHSGEETNVILGTSYNESFENQVGITLIATAFKEQDENLEPTNSSSFEINNEAIESTQQEKKEVESVETVTLEQLDETSDEKYQQTTLEFNENQQSSMYGKEGESEINENGIKTTITSDELFNIQKPHHIYEAEEKVVEEIHKENTNAGELITEEELKKSIHSFQVKEVEEPNIDEQYTVKTDTEEEVSNPTSLGTTQQGYEQNVNPLYAYEQDAVMNQNEEAKPLSGEQPSSLVQNGEEVNTQTSVQKENTSESLQNRNLSTTEEPNTKSAMSKFTNNLEKIDTQALHNQPSYLRNEAMKRFIEDSKLSAQKKGELSNYGVDQDEQAHSKINALNQFLFGAKPD